MDSWKEAYDKWHRYEDLEQTLKKELYHIKDNPMALKDAFHQELSFGTGGMRGILGPGTNRMNIYTVRKAVSGLAEYLSINCVNYRDRGVVVAYDPRYLSREFAIESAKVLGTFGIKAYVFNSLRPTPLLSYAVRYLGTAAGIMITASHNPPEYNGLKVYNEDGGQMTLAESHQVINATEKIDNELTIEIMNKKELKDRKLLEFVGDEIDDAYLDQLSRMSKMNGVEMAANKKLKIVFTPLHGTAHDLVVSGLKQLNFDVHIVASQVAPDPEFSTVKSPNPESPESFTMAKSLGHEVDADILLGTDPDADRLGVAVKDETGKYTVLTGNQLGALLLDYILSQSDPVLLKNARMLKSIVTTELGTAIATSFGVKTVNTLTGFKFISEKIRQYDSTGETFIFGFEESYGYLMSSFSRDKDAVQAAVMACEMANYWKEKGKTLLDALLDLYHKHGFYLEGISELTLKGIEGSAQINSIMNDVRYNAPQSIGGLKVLKIEDYLTSKRKLIGEQEQIETITLPQENVMKFILEDKSWVCLRPSGTEPKIKSYYGVCSDQEEQSKQRLADLEKAMESIMNQSIQPS